MMDVVLLILARYSSRLTQKLKEQLLPRQSRGQLWKEKNYQTKPFVVVGEFIEQASDQTKVTNKQTEPGRSPLVQNLVGLTVSKQTPLYFSCLFGPKLFRTLPNVDKDLCPELNDGLFNIFSRCMYYFYG